MYTTIFEWWKKRGGTLGELAEKLNYHPDYIGHLAAGDYPITESFMARCVLHLGEEIRFLFFESDVGIAPPDYRKPTAISPEP